MATFNKFHAFVEHVFEAVHNFASDATCSITVALLATANAPSASLDAVLADVTQISYTNLSSRVVSVSSSAQVTGTYRLIVNDLVLTASGGPVAAFQYVVLYNDDPTSPADPLICWYDYGSALTLADGETLTLDFDGTNGLFSVT